MSLITKILANINFPTTVAQLERWSWRTDLPGTDYFVKRSYEDSRAFMELRWVFYRKGHHTPVYVEEQRVSLNNVMDYIRKFEKKDLLEGLEYNELI